MRLYMYGASNLRNSVEKCRFCWPSQAARKREREPNSLSAHQILSLFGRTQEPRETPIQLLMIRSFDD